MDTMTIDDIKTTDDFSAYVAQLTKAGAQQPGAYAIGLATYSDDERLLDVRYPVTNLEGDNPGVALILGSLLGLVDLSGSRQFDKKAQEQLLNALDPFRDDGKTHSTIDALDIMQAELARASVCFGGTRRLVVTFIRDLRDAPLSAEGRISQGVFVGANTDLGGSTSLMGTLSGGGKKRISVGENCLVGANAGLGISLGDRCTVEAGLYLTAGTKITFAEEIDGSPVGTTSKASSFSGDKDLLFRRNSVTGTVEVLINQEPINLNAALHGGVIPEPTAD